MGLSMDPLAVGAVESTTWRERAVHQLAKLLGVHVSTRPCWCDVKYAAHAPVEQPKFVAADWHHIASIKIGNQGEGMINSAKFNAFVQDMNNDMMRPRPVIAGGTGAAPGPEAA